MNDNDKLDEMLLRNDVPPASSNLAHRISQAALDHTAQQTRYISWIDEVLRLFVIPKPAYITTCCLICGLMMGAYIGVEETITQDWFSFIEEQEEGWL